MTDKIYLIILLLVLTGLLLTGVGVRRMFGRRKLSGAFNSLLGITLVAMAVAGVGVVANLYTYHQLSGEQSIGTLSFEKFAPQEFIATLAIGSETPQQYTVFGDECQLDARILKWHYFANLLGFDTAYRLERISGRYRDIAAETGERRSVYALSENPGIEIWSIINRFNDWIPWMDAIYGNAIYLPMESGAAYQITVSNTGLLGRPQNDVARQAIKRWQ